MNDHEKYLFDLRGHIVVKNAPTAGQVEDLSARLEARRKAKGRPGSDRTISGRTRARPGPHRRCWKWGGTYIDPIDLPTIAPYLETLVGTGYRLDHDHINVINAEHPSRLYLHGGGQGAGGPRDVVGPTDGGQCFYRYNNGQFFNGLLAVAFELNDVTPSSGGFACVAGSHKVDFALPGEWRISKKQADIPACVDRVTAQAGDAIVFTEAGAHGTVPWEGGRRTTNGLLQVLPPRGGLGAVLLQRRPLRGSDLEPTGDPASAERLRATRSHAGDLAARAGGADGVGTLAQGSG